MTKSELKAKLYEIQAMGKMELEAFKRKVEDSLLDAKPKDFLRRALEIREQELNPKNHLAEHGEIKFAEMDDE